MLRLLASQSRQRKQSMMVFIDSLILLVALELSFSLRLENIFIPNNEIVLLFIISIISAIPIFFYFGLYNTVTRYINLDFLLTIFQATIVHAIIFGFLIFLGAFEVAPSENIPRSIIFINWIILILLLSSSRLTARWLILNSTISSHMKANKTENVAILGTSEDAISLAERLKYSSNIKIICFFSNSKKEIFKNQKIFNLPVHSMNDLNKIINKHNIERLLVSENKLYKDKYLLDILENIPIRIEQIPSLSDILDGKSDLSSFKKLNISKLLEREVVPPVQELLNSDVKKRSVLVTGAGGSIGSELCLQLINLNPIIVILLDHDEFSLYEITGKLNEEKNKKNIKTKFLPVLGSVNNEELIKKICNKYKINTVYHAAAYKHVNILENNIIEGAKNNILGTYSCVKASITAEVNNFVLISTDKAVRPTSIMGVTKRISEMIVQSKANANTRFSIVRFGNVIGSSGSVIPLFEKQISQGGPITVTHEDVIRYFMTITEASQLVIQAGAMGNNGEVFLLDMGKQVKIYDLAKKMIHLRGLTVKDRKNPDGDIEISIIGLGKGEKLFEELVIGKDSSITKHPRILVSKEEGFNSDLLINYLEDINSCIESFDEEQIIDIFQKLIPDFNYQK